MSNYILAIDQGTTSTRSIIFDQNLAIISIAQQEFQQHFPNPGWVEHDSEDIWKSAIDTAQSAIKKVDLNAKDIASIGIANQRETTLVWNKKTGKAIYPAIVWQDRRTAKTCDLLKSKGIEHTTLSYTHLTLPTKRIV